MPDDSEILLLLLVAAASAGNLANARVWALPMELRPGVPEAGLATGSLSTSEARGPTIKPGIIMMMRRGPGPLRWPPVGIRQDLPRHSNFEAETPSRTSPKAHLATLAFESRQAREPRAEGP